MASLGRYRCVSEEWLQNRREYSPYRGYYATEKVQNEFQKITGLEDDIVKCDKDSEMQLWIDNIVTKLCKKYESIYEPKEDTYDILLKLGFCHKVLVDCGIYENRDSWVYGHMDLDENIELVIDYIFRDIID